MRDRVVKSRVPTWGWGALAAIGVVYLAAICVLFVLIWEQRRDINLGTIRLPAAMLAFERSIGYDGLIHNFKNYVLRPGEEEYGRTALANHAVATAALDEVERIAAQTGLEMRLEEIRATIDRYRDRVAEITSAHEEGVPLAETDRQIRVTDAQALDDLRAAHDAISQAITRDLDARRVRITVMIGVITLLMLLLPAGAFMILELRRREERGYVARIEALNAGLDSRNEKLAAANHALSVTNAELNEFAHAASHDLRTPLRGISHEAEYLVHEFGEEMDREVTERLVHIQALCGRLDNVTTLLLRYARLSPPTQVDMVDPLGVIEEIETGIGARLASAGATIAVETELPPVACKRFDLGTVFQKLIENALLYNRSSEKEIAVGYLPGAENGGEVIRDVFYVRDNGIGIPLDHHDDVFRMFKRLHHDDAFGPGAGAGLSFVKKIVGNYGGTVWLASEPGAGTTVYFSLGRHMAKKEDYPDQRQPFPDGLAAVGI